MALLSKDKKQAPAPEGSPEERLRAVMAGIVNRVGELSAMAAELDQAEDAVRAANPMVGVPPNYCGGLWPSLAATQRAWALHRRDLTGGPPPPSKLELAIAQTRNDIQNAQEALARCEKALQAQPGASKDVRTMGLASDWAQNLRSARSRLGELLSQLPQTGEIRRERLALAEANEGDMIQVHV
jgi:hypothetical protein